jgi:hypothetical protein
MKIAGRLAAVPAAKPKPESAPAPKPAKAAKPAKRAKPGPAVKKRAKQPNRPPAFSAPGAPKEPLDEMPLDQRAQLLKRYVESHPHRTSATSAHFLYQHAWIVTGAKFGWFHGAKALEILIAVDRRVQAVWGIGAKSERVAADALAFVRAKSR